MKKIITLIFFMMPAVAMFAQQSNTKGTNANAAGLDHSVITGHFEMEKLTKDKKGHEHINVNYAVSPAPFDKILNLELSTAENMLFSAVITDAKNKELAKWAPHKENYFYRTSIDIASLVPGDYLLTIYWEMDHGMHHYNIPFTKSKQ